MDEPAAYSSPADRWLGEFLTASRAAYLASPDYRRKLHRESAPLFASPSLRAA